MQQRKQPLTVNLPPQMLELLIEEAYRQRRSRSFVIEEALRAYLGMPSQIGLPTPPPLPDSPFQNPSDPDLEEATLSDQDTK